MNETEFEQALNITVDAVCAVTGDLEVWLKEARNTEARLPAWPQPVVGDGFRRWIETSLSFAVEAILQAIGEAEGLDNVPPQDPQDPGFQLVLRVALQAALEVERRLVEQMGGVRLTGVREFRNRLNTELASQAVRAGGNRTRAIAQAGVSSRSVGYRAMKRRR